jgi:hypothetical protein
MPGRQPWALHASSLSSEEDILMVKLMVKFLKRLGVLGYEQELTRGHDCEPRARQGAATDSSSAGGASAGVTVDSRGKQPEVGCEQILLISCDSERKAALVLNLCPLN